MERVAEVTAGAHPAPPQQLSGSARGGHETISHEGALRLLHLLTHDPDTLPSVEEFAWTAPLMAGERQQMQREFADATAEAFRSGDWTPLSYLEDDWRATAEAVTDPALMAELNAGWDLTQAVPLPRP